MRNTDFLFTNLQYKRLQDCLYFEEDLKHQLTLAHCWEVTVHSSSFDSMTTPDNGSAMCLEALELVETINTVFRNCSADRGGSQFFFMVFTSVTRWACYVNSRANYGNSFLISKQKNLEKLEDSSFSRCPSKAQKSGQISLDSNSGKKKEMRFVNVSNNSPATGASHRSIVIADFKAEFNTFANNDNMYFFDQYNTHGSRSDENIFNNSMDYLLWWPRYLTLANHFIISNNITHYKSLDDTPLLVNWVFYGNFFKDSASITQTDESPFTHSLSHIGDWECKTNFKKLTLDFSLATRIEVGNGFYGLILINS